jgi:N-methylhydantoinase A
VTDAHFYLGRLEERWFLDGKVALDMERVEEAMVRLASSIGKTPREAAMGIIEVANVNMERAIRVISLERGHDPGDYTLVTFGGAGALHACDIATDLSIPSVLIPGDPGALSAKGMLMTDVVMDHSASVLMRWREWGGRLSGTCHGELEERASREIRDEIGKGGRFNLLPSLDMRYVGQSYELNVPWSDRADEEFHSQHQLRYGYSSPDKPVEVVTARIRAIGEISSPDIRQEEFLNLFPRRFAGSRDLSPGGSEAGEPGQRSGPGRRIFGDIPDSAGFRGEGGRIPEPPGKGAEIRHELRSGNSRDFSKPVPFGRGRDGGHAHEDGLLSQHQGEEGLFLRRVRRGREDGRPGRPYAGSPGIDAPFC